MSLVLFALGMRFAGAGEADAARPHIVLIVADDYGYHDVGYHGSRIRTPNLDRLAGEGVKLENYYVQPICTPTRSQLLSGRYQIHTGLQHSIIHPNQPNGLPLDSPTLADELKEAGYSTHMVGKWHLGFYRPEYLPNNRGFDSFYGYLTGAEDYYTHYREGGLDLHHNLQPDFSQKGTYSTQLFTQKAVDIINAHDKSKPLFLYLPYQSVHGPLEVPPRYTAQYHDIKDSYRRKYAGMVTCMDEGVGNVTSALQERGMLNNTVLVFTTDNGGQVHVGGNNWPLRGWKGSLWEGGVRGVGFVHSPLLLKKGYVNKSLMHVSDWFPTFVKLAGGSRIGAQPLDGFDQWDTISNDTVSARQELLHNIDILYGRQGTPLYPDAFDTRVRAAIRLGDYKLITGDPGEGSWVPPPEAAGEHRRSAPAWTADKAGLIRRVQNVWLFNITADPEERHDLTTSEPEVVKHLLQRLSHYNSTAVPPRYPEPDPESNPKLHGGVWGPWEK